MQKRKVELHPASLRHLAQGHPWVIKDQYTEHFRAKDRLLEAFGKKKTEHFLLLADTAHPKIKARLWESSPDEAFSFEESLKERLDKAFEKRKDQNLLSERENLFLTFGEGDFLPGLFVIFLKEGLYIQSYARYWKKLQKDLVPLLRASFENHFAGVELKWVAWQERDEKQDSPLTPLWGKVPQEILLKEHGVHYLLRFFQGYDYGLYTDMAAIRRELTYSWGGKKVLNLFCYTGAWSLYPLHEGAAEVTSVDLSPKYMEWLEENLALNSFQGNHTSLCQDVDSALKELTKTNQKFDFILCDPPSFSSDGKKQSSALKSYDSRIALMEELLAPEGQALLFLNTHSVTRKKFETSIRDALKGTSLKVIGKVGLSSDCPRLKGFPEGDYLKGMLIQKR